MIYRFGNNWGGRLARTISAVATIVTTVGMLAYLIKALGIFASMFFPISPEMCALVMVVIATVYTMVSGFYGVVYTDLLQSGIVISMIVIISFLAFFKIAGPGDLAAIAQKVTGNHGRARL